MDSKEKKKKERAHGPRQLRRQGEKQIQSIAGEEKGEKSLNFPKEDEALSREKAVFCLGKGGEQVF